MSERAFVGLGSNLGDRLQNLRAGVHGLAGRERAEIVAVSPVFETAPVGGPAQGDYLNAVCELEWRGAARGLLETLLEIETGAGRVRGGERDSPRTLDLDLLLFGEQRIDEPGLVVPHPRMTQRGFVLEPLARLVPLRRHPVRGESYSDLALAVRGSEDVRPYGDASLLLR